MLSDFHGAWFLNMFDMFMSLYAKPTHDLPCTHAYVGFTSGKGFGSPRWLRSVNSSARKPPKASLKSRISTVILGWTCPRSSHIPKLNTFKDFKVNYGRHWCFHVCISSVNMKLNAVLYCTVQISTLDSDGPDTQCLPSKNSAGHSNNGFLLYLRSYSGTPYDIAIWMTLVFHETRKESHTSTMNKHIITI